MSSIFSGTSTGSSGIIYYPTPSPSLYIYPNRIIYHLYLPEKRMPADVHYGCYFLTPGLDNSPGSDYSYFPNGLLRFNFSVPLGWNNKILIRYRDCVYHLLPQYLEDKQSASGFGYQIIHYTVLAKSSW